MFWTTKCHCLRCLLIKLSVMILYVIRWFCNLISKKKLDFTSIPCNLLKGEGINFVNVWFSMFSQTKCPKQYMWRSIFCEKASIQPGVCCLMHPLFWDFKFYVFFFLVNKSAFITQFRKKKIDILAQVFLNLTEQSNKCAQRCLRTNRR